MTIYRLTLLKEYLQSCLLTRMSFQLQNLKSSGKSYILERFCKTGRNMCLSRSTTEKYTKGKTPHLINKAGLCFQILTSEAFLSFSISSSLNIVATSSVFLVGLLYLLVNV